MTYTPLNFVNDQTGPSPAAHPVSAESLMYMQAGIVAASTNPSALLVGESTQPRHGIDAGNPNAPTLVSGRLTGAQFVAQKTETITQVATYCGTAAGATPTLVRFGVYSVAPDGTHTLVASTVSDTALLNAGSNAKFTKALSASWSKVAGQRYCIAALVVTSATTPKVLGQAGWGGTTVAPALATRVDGQTDLPSTIAPGSLVAAGAAVPYFEVLP